MEVSGLYNMLCFCSYHDNHRLFFLPKNKQIHQKINTSFYNQQKNRMGVSLEIRITQEIIMLLEHHDDRIEKNISFGLGKLTEDFSYQESIFS